MLHFRCAQPVTMVRSHGKSRVKTDLKHGPQEQPKQLFWEKRLQNLRACDQTGEEMIAMELPRLMQGVGPEMTTENLLHRWVGRLNSCKID